MGKGSVSGWVWTGSGTGFTGHQGLHENGRRYNSFPILQYGIFEKAGLVDQTNQSVTLRLCC